MLVYFAEVSASLYLLYRHLDFSPQQSFLGTILYVCMFFIPFDGLSGTLLWYPLAVRAARRIYRERPFDVIYATGEPYSAVKTR